MNINHSSRFRKISSIAVSIMFAGSLMAPAAQAVTSTPTSTASPLPAVGAFIQFNNLVVQSASSGGVSPVIVAALTPNSQCLSFGNNTMNNVGRAITCPTSPYNLQVGPGTQLFFRGKNFAPFSTFAAGDMVNTFGFYSPSTSNVQASLVRDLSKTKGSVGTDPLANLTIAKTIDNASPQVGATVNYTLTASALGPENSTGVAVQDTLPAGVSFVHATPSAGAYSTSTGIWTIGTLATGTIATLGIEATVSASDTVGQTVVNTAAISEDSLLTDDNATSSSAAFTVATSTVGNPTSTTSTADLAVTKTVDNAAPQVGATVNYTVTASDMGPANSESVAVSDLLPLGLTFVSATSSVGTYNSASGTWAIGELSPSSTATLGIQAMVDASDTVGQTIVNTATGSEDDNVIDPAANNTASASITVASTTVTPSSTVAGLTILAAADNLEPQPGATVSYTLTVSALGPAISTGVAATDILPSGVTFVSATSSVGTYTSSTGAWTIGDLSPNATATLEIAATVNSVEAPGQTITNIATVREDQTLTNPDVTQESSSVTIAVAEPIIATSTADLAVTKTVDNAAPQVGATVNYTVTASDMGPANSESVAVSDLLPLGLTFVSATSSVGTYNSASGTWAIGELSPSSTATLGIQAMVDASDTVGQTIVNTATGSEDDNVIDPAANNTASASITVASTTPIIATSTADLAVTKTVDNAAPQAGAMVNYTVTATDLGPSSSTGVAVNDLLPAGLTFVSATSSAGTYDSASGTWAIGTLAPSSTATLGIQAMVDASDTVGQTIVNTAMASEDASIVDPSAANNTASATIIVASTTPVTATSTAGLEVMKTIDNAAPQAGATVNYTITASAMGPSSSTGVAVNDLLPSGMTFVSALPSSGTYSAASGTWAIGTLAPSSTATLKITAMVNPSDVVGRVITNTAMATEDASLVNPDSAQATASVTLTVAFPTPIVPATLSIGTDGSFLARGMIVTSVGSSTFQAQVWGNTYTVNFVGNGDNDGDEFLFRSGNTPFNFSRNGGHFSDQVVVGDIVNVSGHVTTAAPFVVTANVVRNDSTISPRQPRPFQFGSEDNGNGQFNFGTSTNGNGNGGNDHGNGNNSGNGNGNGDNSSSGPSSSGSSTSVSLQTQLNGLATELQQLEQLFQGQFGQNH